MSRITALINDNWFFTKEQINPAAPPFDGMERVSLPHTWNAFDGQDGGGDFYRATCWYARRMDRPAGEEIWLEFGAVSQIAVVYVNGKEAGRHEAGFSTFRVNLTPHLRDGENVIAVSADNGENQRTYPQFADFTFYGGIYRDVSLITVPKRHFDLSQHGAPGIHVTPVLGEDGTATVTVKAFATAAEGTRLRFAIADREGQIVAEKEGTAQEAVFTLAQPHLWNGVRDPYLYTATASLLDASGATLDEAGARFGVRSFRVDPQEGFFLNGVLTPLRGVSRHQCREDKGWAISHDDEKQDIALIAEMGANTIRLAHYQHSQSFYDLCDEYGMVVWAEIPLISSFMDNPQARENTLLQMRELIMQSYNHPAICFWGISNEITMGGDDDPALLENQRALNALCHELDSTRLTTLANLSMVDTDSPQNDLTDVLSYNHYFGWYGGTVEENAPWFDAFHQERPGIAVGLSEYGAEGNINLHSENPEVRDYTEEYQCVYHEGMLEMLTARPWIWSSHVWNMFEFGSDMRDEGLVQGRNNKGLVNFSRTVKKDAYFLYKAYWTDAPFVHLCGRRFAQRCGETTRIKVYAAGVDEVSLLINGAEAGRATGERIFTFEAVQLSMGANTVLAAGYRNGERLCVEEITLQRVAEPNPDYRLPEDQDTAGADSVANWFDPAYAQGEMTFKEGYFSIKDRFGDVMGHPVGEQMMLGMFETILGSMTGGDGKKGGFKMNRGMLKMMGRMTFEDIAKMAGKRLPAGTIQMVNSKLQEIKKDS